MAFPLCGGNARRQGELVLPTNTPEEPKFLAIALSTLELVPVPNEENKSEQLIRDANDRPILRAAIAAKADVLLTGDKDFLEANVTSPVIVAPAEFLAI